MMGSSVTGQDRCRGGRGNVGELGATSLFVIDGESPGEPVSPLALVDDRVRVGRVRQSGWAADGRRGGQGTLLG
jgi:hypothetical protein